VSAPKMLSFDDEANFRANLRKMVQLEGLRAVAVGSGAQELKARRQQTCDMLLLDLRPLDTTGLKTLAHCRPRNVPEGGGELLRGRWPCLARKSRYSGHSSSWRESF